MVPLTHHGLHADYGGQARTRVMFILSSFAGGGAERMVAQLVNRIDSREFDARVGLLWRDGAYLAEVNEADLVVPRLMHGWVAYRDRPAWWQVLPSLFLVPMQQYEVVRRFRPDVVVTVTRSMNIAARFSLGVFGRRRPIWIVREGNNTAAMIDSETPAGLGRRLQDAAVRVCYSAANRIVAISDGVAVGLTKRFGLNPQRVTRVFNAVDVDAVQARSAELPWPSIDAPFIVAAGRLDRQKGFDVLIRAFAGQIASRGVSLLILGEGPERDALGRLAEELGVRGSVHLPGFVDNPWSHFARASLFVCASRWEGFGNVIIEAMACGAPIVATDCDFGPREIVQPGETGLLVPVDDVQALGHAIASVLDDPALAARLSGGSRRRAQEFSVARMIHAYEELFRMLAAENRSMGAGSV